MAVLSIEAVSCARAADGSPSRLPAGAAELDDGARLLVAYVRQLTGTVPDGLSLWSGDREGIADLALRALGGLGAPTGGRESLVLVQRGHDREHHTVPLPRVSHEVPWEITEEFGLSHLESAPHTGVFEMLGWLLEPWARGTVLIADHTEYALGPVPPDDSVTAVRVVAGAGPLRVTGSGTGMPETGGDLVLKVPGDGWEVLARLLAGPVPGLRLFLVEASAPGEERWLLLETGGPAEAADPAEAGPR
ncbi:hypothetical protein [Streptomyces sp. NPDC058486]|uniref:hypothetical protein n=1 Tax=unclassified Streptomyces TaxID=2593676 RepID=UPI00364C9966